MKQDGIRVSILESMYRFLVHLGLFDTDTEALWRKMLWETFVRTRKVQSSMHNWAPMVRFLDIDLMREHIHSRCHKDAYFLLAAHPEATKQDMIDGLRVLTRMRTSFMYRNIGRPIRPVEVKALRSKHLLDVLYRLPLPVMRKVISERSVAMAKASGLMGGVSPVVLRDFLSPHDERHTQEKTTPLSSTDGGVLLETEDQHIRFFLETEKARNIEPNIYSLVTQLCVAYADKVPVAPSIRALFYPSA